MNEPILLRPSGKDYLWGGRRLKDEFAKDIDLAPLAETWECSTHPDGPSFAAEGEFRGSSLAEILRAHPEFLGKKYRGQTELPILIKFIDAKQDLSVQVHPDDAYAMEHENGERGKTEFWYVLDAEEDARLVCGFCHDVDEKTVREAVADGTLRRHLQEVPVRKDDLFFIEAGTVHALGAGTLVAEIQESSNLTYRLYDYDRTDRDGKKRGLHLEKALQVMDRRRAGEARQPLRVLRYREGEARELLCRCRYFEVCRMIVNTERHRQVWYQTEENAFRVLLCIKGCGTVSTENSLINFFKGDCIFVPAGSGEFRIHGQAQFLEVRG